MLQLLRFTRPTSLLAASLVSFLGIAPLATPAAAEPVAAATPSAYPVAGLQPYQRPVGAPVIKEFPRTLTWRATALRGVSQPYPASLGFLDNQGAWYTPFAHPGMPTPYDLRELHGKATPKVAPGAAPKAH